MHLFLRNKSVFRVGMLVRCLRHEMQSANWRFLNQTLLLREYLPPPPPERKL